MSSCIHHAFVAIDDVYRPRNPEENPDGRRLYRFKRPSRDGTTHIVLGPVEMLEKLAASQGRLLPPDVNTVENLKNEH